MVTLVNRAKMSTATTGTGTITLGSAASGYQSFAAAGVADGDVVRYVIEDGNNWEIGEGIYTSSGTTLSRNPSESSSAGAPINLSGSAVVFVGAAAQDFFGSSPWVRNPSWPACEAAAGSNKVVGLYAVWPGDGVGAGGNFFAVTNAGAYTVDFGDGTTTNYATGTTAEREYSFSAAALTNTNAPVTLTASSNTVNRTAHGYKNGDILQLYSIATTTGIEQGQDYYVTNATANSFQISQKTYNAFSFSAREATPTGVFFKPDGLKVYIVGSGTDAVLEYNLSLAWNLATATFVQSLSVSGQETNPTGIFFKSDGLKMYIVGSTGDDVNEYNLSTAWNISTASFVQVFSVATQDIVPTGVFFKPDGLKMYIVGGAGQDINEYNLSTAWNVSTASFVQVFSVSGQETSPGGVFFKPDGLKMYVVGTSGTDILEYTLGTAWNISTATFVQAFFVANQGTSPTDVFITDDGLTMYVLVSSADSVFGYKLGTAWDISTAVFEQQTTIVDFSNDGSAALLPYKIATVTITPQGGSNLTSLNFFVKHSQANLANGYSTGWLDIAIAAPNCTSLTLGSSASTVRHNLLERVRLNQLGSITSFASLFRNCRALQNLSIASTITTVTNTSNMFTACSSLVKVPLFNTASVTSVSSMFSNCSLLETIPLFNTQSATDMSFMFQNCFYLAAVPLLNTGSCTTMASMFQSCTSLLTVPLFNTVSVTIMSNMFNGCSALTTVPLFNTSVVTDMSSMFAGCTYLISVPLFNTVSCTSMTAMFQNCGSLLTIPLLNTASVTSIASMFINASALADVPAIVTTACTAAGSFTNTFNNCNSIARIQAKDFRFTFSVASCKLSATALNEIYTNLPTVTSQTITVSGNYGIAGDNPTIATAKGWTVSGS